MSSLHINYKYRRQPEHFLKVSCQRMGVLFSLHLSLAAVCFSVFSFAQCHKYSWNLKVSYSAILIMRFYFHSLSIGS